MLTKFLKNGEVIYTYGNGDNFQLYNGAEFHLCLIIRNLFLNEYYYTGSISKHLIGNISLDFLKDRFYKKNIFIMQEESIKKEKLNNPPDLAFVTSKYITSIDHFRVDASEAVKKLNKKGKYEFRFQKFLNTHKEESIDNLLKFLQEENIEFRDDYWEWNIKYVFNKHIKDLNKTEKTIKDFIKTGKFPNIIKEDLEKNIKHWMLIDERTPGKMPNWLWGSYNTLLQNNTNIEGIIWCHNPYPWQMPNNLNNILIIKNDDISYKKLEEKSKIQY